MGKLEKAWMTFGITMFILQLASLLSDAVVFLVLVLFFVGCGLGFASLLKIVHHYTESTNVRVIKYRVENDKGTKAEKLLKAILKERDEDDADERSPVYS